MKYIIFNLLLLTFLNIQCATNDINYDTNHYNIYLRLDPENQYINVKLNLELNSVKPIPDTLIFYLHKQFTLRNVTGDGIQEFTFDKEMSCPIRWIPEGRTILIRLQENVNKSRSLDISFEYDGNISEWPTWCANVITDEWMELGEYLPWFPYNQSYGLLTFEIEAECDTTYHLRSFDNFTFKNGKWHFKWMNPTTDIVLVASKTLKTMKKERNSKVVFVHYSTLQDTTAEKLANDLIGVFELFDKWFGGNKKGEIAVIESLRKKGGGYAREGLISLAGLSDKRYFNRHEAYIRYLAHEASHMWWLMAPTNNWEDWLNEGFAEYCALLVVRELYGEEPFKRRMEEKKNALKDTPPIWGFDRNDRSTPEKSNTVEANLYSKGPVLLHQLSERIGIDNFFTLCKEMVELNTSSTNDFLELLLKNYGNEVENWFEYLLKSY